MMMVMMIILIAIIVIIIIIIIIVATLIIISLSLEVLPTPLPIPVHDHDVGSYAQGNCLDDIGQCIISSDDADPLFDHFALSLQQQPKSHWTRIKPLPTIPPLIHIQLPIRTSLNEFIHTTTTPHSSLSPPTNNIPSHFEHTLAPMNANIDTIPLIITQLY